MLVENVYDLQNIDAKLDGNYLLAGDIDASDTRNWSDAGTANNDLRSSGEWAASFGFTIGDGEKW